MQLEAKQAYYARIEQKMYPLLMLVTETKKGIF